TVRTRQTAERGLLPVLPGAAPFYGGIPAQAAVEDILAEICTWRRTIACNRFIGDTLAYQR
ncbi:MAG: hypothetical protein MUP74_01340, partial [Desulfobacterales bacterium]|nr:hypothetical protein [Desulfobacterales bacterium]